MLKDRLEFSASAGRYFFGVKGFTPTFNPLLAFAKPPKLNKLLDYSMFFTLFIAVKSVILRNISIQ